MKKKHLRKTQHPFMIETQPSGNGGNTPQRDKATHDKPTANIMLNGDK